MKKNKNRSELVKQLLLQNPGMSEKDIAQEFHKSDKGSVPYWAKFILVFLIRLAAVSGLVMATTTRMKKQGLLFIFSFISWFFRNLPANLRRFRYCILHLQIPSIQLLPIPKYSVVR
jgi:hypothetical protein